MTESQRPDPEALLRALRRDPDSGPRGRLKVFLGMCPGVGKTYAMLESALRERAAGRDVVVGYVETHGRAETAALCAGLETLPRATVPYRGTQLPEMDLEAVLARRPALVLVDELAHTNAPGTRHPKRWQDVMELRDAGIEVWTTLNVQHVESRADTVRQVTGVEIRETVPDSVLDGAVLELVDLPPAELSRRLREGRVYVADRAEAAARAFFREANLTALRELALRLVADHVGADTRGLRTARAVTDPWKTSHCLLVAVGPGPFSEPLIRSTRRMADSLGCRWIAVHVEGSQPLTPAARGQLDQNLAAARELGAEVITTTDDDLVGGLLRVARAQNVTQIILGKPAGRGPLDRLRANRLLRRMASETGDIDLLVVRAGKQADRAPGARWISPGHSTTNQYVFAAAAIGLTGLLNFGLMAVAGPRVPGLVFLLAVVLVALRVGRGPVMLAGAMSALAWDYFFLPPRFTFAIQRLEDAVLFAMHFVVAVVLGQLVARIRMQEQAERRREERAVALYEFMRDMAEAASRDEVVWQLVSQVQKVFRAPVAVVVPSGNGLMPHPDGTLALGAKELGVADWAFRQRRTAGRGTDNLPAAEAFHIPLHTKRGAFGVLSIRLPEERPSLAQQDLLETFASQAALILERSELRAAAEQARLVAESEKFSRTLLNSISHELRTPLAAITSAASSLAAAGEAAPAHRHALLGEILEANRRLNHVVGNLLDMARLEAGKVRPRLDWHDVRDLVQTTLHELAGELAGYPVRVDLPPGPLLAHIDFSLLQHVLQNLLLNVACHTPPGTPIEVKGARDGRELVLWVADRGPGIDERLLPLIFDKFFRAPTAPAGGSGLGLSLVRGLTEAHGGRAEASNRPGGGALFTLHLPQPDPPVTPDPPIP